MEDRCALIGMAKTGVEMEDSGRERLYKNCFYAGSTLYVAVANSAASSGMIHEIHEHRDDVSTIYICMKK